MVPVTFIAEPKSTTILNPISLLDLGIDSYDSAMIFKNWSYNQDKFHFRILNNHIHKGDDKNISKKEVIKVGFQDYPHNFDWAEMIGPIRSPPEPQP